MTGSSRLLDRLQSHARARSAASSKSVGALANGASRLALRAAGPSEQDLRRLQANIDHSPRQAAQARLAAILQRASHPTTASGGASPLCMRAVRMDQRPERHPARPAIPQRAVAQGVLYLSRNAREPVSKEVLDLLIHNDAKNVVKKAMLQTAYAHAGKYYYLTLEGTPFGSGRHPFSVQGISEFQPTPAVPGRGTLKVALDPDKELGYTFEGRPAWSKDVVAQIMTIKGKENIRHIIPYHMIRDGFIRYLNATFAVSGRNYKTTFKRISNLSVQLGAGDAVRSLDSNDADDYKEPLIRQSILVLNRLNSIPGNLWAGDAEENQRLNSLRVRVDNISEVISSGEVDGKEQVYAVTKLKESLEGAGTETYKELIAGALGHLESESDLSKAQVLERLELLVASTEFDVMPAIPELKRVHEATTLGNVARLQEIIKLFQANDFPQAASELTKLKSPHEIK